MKKELMEGMEKHGEEKKTKIALLGIMVHREEAVKRMNELLHQYGGYIVGRMGIPYEKRNVNIISLVMDAPEDVIHALSGRLGQIPDLTVKTMYAKETLKV